MIRLNNQRTLSTGRALTACGALLFVSIAPVAGLQSRERPAAEDRVSVKAWSHLPPQPAAAFPGSLPVLTEFQEAQVDSHLKPEAIHALLREVEERYKAANEKLRYYSYILKRTEHQLNKDGVSTKYRVHEYRVFPRGKGLVVTAMLSENGKELDPKKLGKEKAKANKEWQKHRKDREKEPEKIGPWFDGLDFVALPGERLDDRDVIVFSFTPRADYTRPKNSNRVTSDLKGQVWIDPQEKMLVKFQAELTKDFRQGGLSGWLSALKPGTAITIENTRLGNGLWVVNRVDVSSIVRGPGFLMLPHTERFRFVDDYREFDPDATDLFR